MATTAQEAHDTFTMPFIILAERNRAVMEKVARVTQEETLHFLNQNLERNVHALERLRECRGVSGVMEVETEWLTGMVRDSIEQTQRVAKLWWRLAEEESEAGVQSSAEAMASSARKGREATKRAEETDQRRAAA